MSACLTGLGGMEMAILNMYKYLSEKVDLDVEIVIFSGNEDNIRKLFEDKFLLLDIYRLGGYKKFISQISAYNQLKKMIKNDSGYEKVILIATDPWTLGVGNMVKKKYYNVRSILWSHFNVDIYLNSKTWLYNRFTFKNADLIYVLNSWSKNKLSEELGTDNIKILPNGIKIDNNSFVRYKKGEFIYIGRVDNYTKNLDILFNSLIGLNGQWTLTVIGTGLDLNKYIDFAKTNNLSERVTFKGWVDNPWNEINEGAFLVLPTINEGFGLVLIEAMSRGLPAIVNSKAEGPKDIVKDNINGFFFDSVDTLNKIIQDEINNSIGEVFDKDEIKNSVKKFDINIVGANFYNEIRNI